MTITTKVLACGAAATAAAGALLCGGTAVADANCGKPTCFTSIRVDNGVIVADWQSPITGPYTVLDQLELSQGLRPEFWPTRTGTGGAIRATASIAAASPPDPDICIR